MAVILKEIILYIMYSNLPKDDPGWKSYANSAVKPETENNVVIPQSLLLHINFESSCFGKLWCFLTDHVDLQSLQSVHGVLCGL